MKKDSFVIVLCDVTTDLLSEVYQMLGRSSRRKNLSLGVVLGINAGESAYSDIKMALAANDCHSGTDANYSLKIMYKLYNGLKVQEEKD